MEIMWVSIHRTIPFTSSSRSLGRVDIRVSYPKSKLWAWVIVELVSLGHGGCLLQVTGRSQHPYAYASRVFSPSTVVRGGAITPKCRTRSSMRTGANSLAIMSRKGKGQFSQAKTRVVPAQHGLLISSCIFFLGESEVTQPQTSTQIPDVAGPQSQPWSLAAMGSGCQHCPRWQAVQSAQIRSPPAVASPQMLTWSHTSGVNMTSHIKRNLGHQRRPWLQ